MTGKPIGRPPLKRGEKSVHLGVRLPESVYARLLVAVDETNARSEAQGLPAVTVGWVARLLIVRGLGRPEVNGALPIYDKEPASEPGSRLPDEVQTRPMPPRKRVRQAPMPEAIPLDAFEGDAGPEPEGVVVRRPDLFEQEGPRGGAEGSSEGSEDAEVLAELLRDTTL